MDREYKFALLFLLAITGYCRADALARLKPEKLEAVHQEVLAFAKQRKQLPPMGRYHDYRANLHVHSALSHDSRGTIEEIVAAARAAGTSVLLFTEHPSERYNYFKDGHRSMRDGVLLIPGAETEGFLVFPTRSMQGLKAGSPQEFADLIHSRGGLTFLSHLEERMNWEISGLTGTEIYNIHADFKDEKNLIAAMRNPLWIVQAAGLFRKYPQEAFSTLQDYPADYLRRWDQLCEKSPLTGIAANDSHQNVGLVVRLLENRKALIEDALGEKLFELNVGTVPALEKLVQGKKPGDVLFQARLDPYENSLRHVGTHLMLSALNEEAVREALESGRAFVSFDWIADATGFNFSANGKERHEMGSALAIEKGLTLRAQAPLDVKWKLLRNGNPVSTASGPAFEYRVTEAGIYRVEAWLNVAGEEMIWILSNPIYVRRLVK